MHPKKNQELYPDFFYGVKRALSITIHLKKITVQ